jgi:hypothetical protein
MKITDDRGAIIDFIGKHHGSPALARDSSEPVIVMEHGEVPAVRVGWAPFFKAVEAHHLALAYDPEGETHRWVPHALAGQDLTADALAAMLPASTPASPPAPE